VTHVGQLIHGERAEVGLVGQGMQMLGELAQRHDAIDRRAQTLAAAVGPT